MKASSQRDLVFDVAMQCGIVTDTTVKSSGGTQSSATARGRASVGSLVAGFPADPTNSIEATKATAEVVVYCDRVQTLAGQVRRAELPADATTGVVTCTDP